MATAEELLSGVLDGTNDSITVDSDLRKIIIPDSIRNIGVESDEEVLELKFSLPRYYGRFDLSEFKIWVSYLTANGEPDAHEVKEVVVDEDTIAFIWQVGRHTTSYRGDVVFALCLRKYFGHIILKEFNTTIATLPVLEGLQTGEAVVQNHADILEQWRIELFGLGDSKVQAIENAGDVELAAIEEARVKSVSDVEAVEANILNTLEEQRVQSIDDVNQKGIEVLASIPEDYTAMNNQVEMLTRVAGPVIRQEVEGKTVAVSDSSNNPLLGLNIYGESEQATTNGYQLFDASKLETKQLGNHTITNNGDGSFSISSTETVSSADGGYFRDYTHEETIALLKKAGNYTLIAGDTINPYLYVTLRSDNGTLIEMSTRNLATNTREITEEMLADESSYLRLGFYISANSEVVTGTIKPMLYTDGDGTWEPFTGGKPAPNPEYPQEIINCNRLRNLLRIDAENKTINGVTFTVNEDFSVTANGTATSPAYFILNEGMTFKAGKTYTLSGCPAGGSTTTGYMLYVENLSARDVGDQMTFKVKETSINRPVILVRSGATVSNLTFYPMIRYGNIFDDTYYPYTGVEELYVDILGKNLYDCRDAADVQAGVIDDDDFVTIEYDNSEGTTIVYKNQWTKPISSLKPNTTYRIVAEVRELNDCILFVTSRKSPTNPESQFNENLSVRETGIYEYLSTTNDFEYTTILASLRTFVQFNAGQNGKCVFRLSVQEVKNEDLNYEPYNHRHSLLMSNPLHGIPVKSGGNYIDTNGQAWVCDEVDEEQGLYIQRINKFVLTGTEDSFALNGELSFTLPLKASPINTEINCMSTHYPGTYRNLDFSMGTYPNQDTEGYRGIAATNESLRIVDNVLFKGDGDAIKVWLAEQYAAGTPLTVWYILEKPIETSLTAEEIEVFKALHTNYPNTTILNDSGAHMKVAYATDTKLYIDNKFAELQAAITNS